MWRIAVGQGHPLGTGCRPGAEVQVLGCDARKQSPVQTAGMWLVGKAA